jgi:hypothetical protein
MVVAQPVPIREQGKVVTIVLSCSISAAVSADHILKRGRYYVALINALMEAGYSIDLWMDNTVETSSKEYTFRYHAMEPGDQINLKHLTYCLAHPSFLRQMLFSAEHVAGKQGAKDYLYGGMKKGGGSYGSPRHPNPKHYPQDALLTPHVRTSEDFDIVTKLKQDLTALGVIEPQ